MLYYRVEAEDNVEHESLRDLSVVQINYLKILTL